jgi:hypothetical protein
MWGCDDTTFERRKKMLKSRNAVRQSKAVSR